MKSTFTFLSLLFFLKISAQTHTQTIGKKFILNGTIHGKNTGRIVISYPSAPNYLIVKDTAEIVGGKFRFIGYIKEPSQASLIGDVSSTSVDDNNFTDIYIEPRKINVELNNNQFKNVRVTGSNTQSIIKRLNRQLKPLSSRLDEFYTERKQLEKQKKAVKTDTEIADLDQKLRIIDSSWKKIYDARDSIEIAFIKTNPRCWYSSDLLYNYIEKLPINTLYSLYNNLSAPVQNGRWGKWLKRDLAKMKNSSLGSIAPDFTVKDVNGNMFSLSSVNKGKYVLLDFWASWCIPCRQDFSILKKIYNEYHLAGLEIIAISEDMDHSKWKTAIEKDSTGMWQHCLIAEDLNKTFQGHSNPNDIFEKYYIQAIPVKILINNEGMIIGRWPVRNGEEQPSLEESLTKIFKGSNNVL